MSPEHGNATSCQRNPRAEVTGGDGMIVLVQRGHHVAHKAAIELMMNGDMADRRLHSLFERVLAPVPGIDP